jgi:CMP-N-acetylneuraminic acid synthetase
MNNCNTYGPTTLGYVMQQQDSLDIDTAWDFELAEIIMKNFCSHID